MNVDPRAVTLDSVVSNTHLSPAQLKELWSSNKLTSYYVHKSYERDLRVTKAALLDGHSYYMVGKSFSLTSSRVSQIVRDIVTATQQYLLYGENRNSDTDVVYIAPSFPFSYYEDIEDILSVRVYNILRKNGIRSLVELQDMCLKGYHPQHIKGFGDKLGNNLCTYCKECFIRDGCPCPAAQSDGDNSKVLVTVSAVLFSPDLEKILLFSKGDIAHASELWSPITLRLECGETPVKSLRLRLLAEIGSHEAIFQVCAMHVFDDTGVPSTTLKWFTGKLPWNIVDCGVTNRGSRVQWFNTNDIVGTTLPLVGGDTITTALPFVVAESRRLLSCDIDHCRVQQEVC